jgi:hypothetical protein
LAKPKEIKVLTPEEEFKEFKTRLDWCEVKIGSMQTIIKALREDLVRIEKKVTVEKESVGELRNNLITSAAVIMMQPLIKNHRDKTEGGIDNDG